jgi:ParB family chromosome partitioning protein
VRETERLVRKMLEPANGPAKAPAGTKDPDVRRLEQELGEKLGAPVEIQHGRDGKGRLVVTYNSLDELDGILGHIS